MRTRARRPFKETWLLFYQAQGKLAEAAKLNHSVLKTFEDIYGKHNPSLMLHLDRLASVYRTQENYELALPLAKRSLEIGETHFGSSSQEVVSKLIGLACIYGSRGDNAEAYVLAERALSIAERISGKYGKAGTCLNVMALIRIEERNWPESISLVSEVLNRIRWYSPEELTALSAKEALFYVARHFFLFEMLQSLCSEEIRLDRQNKHFAVVAGAEQSALNKAFLEELQMTQIAMEYDSQASTHELRDQWQGMESQLARLQESKLDSAERNAKRRELQGELDLLETKLAERVGLVAQTIRERSLTLTNIARSLPSQSALVDFIQYRRADFAAKTNRWREQRYAAYLTFPLARGSKNVVVEHVDLGEAAPINEAIELVGKRMSARQFAAKDLQPALVRLSNLIYAPLAKHLTNVSHLIICPDGQLSRLPFEMLPLSSDSSATRPIGNRFLVEEKTITYVTSGREVVRIASPLTRPAATLSPSDGARARRGDIGKSLVMGNPDFDFDFTNSPPSKPTIQLAGAIAELKPMSRDYHSLKFKPLSGAEAEARSVARLLGDESVLRLGAEAREAELKAVKSPRVLHLATHGFFLSDQEFKQTNSAAWNSAFARLEPAQRGTPNDWENPLVRCGIALAGANRAQKITNAIAEDGLLTGLEASLLNLQGTELVILSACDSGTGDVKIGEGVMSLRRAFRIAGAETVLASHWSVSDKATSQLMTEFMRRWRAGGSRAKAWREAQLTLLRSKGVKEDFSNPYFWSAFTLTGQWQ